MIARDRDLLRKFVRQKFKNPRLNVWPTTKS